MIAQRGLKHVPVLISWHICGLWPDVLIVKLNLHVIACHQALNPNLCHKKMLRLVRKITWLNVMNNYPVDYSSGIWPEHLFASIRCECEQRRRLWRHCASTQARLAYAAMWHYKCWCVYTMGCPPVREDNPRGLASGLSYVQADSPWHNYFIPTTSG